MVSTICLNSLGNPSLRSPSIGLLVWMLSKAFFQSNATSLTRPLRCALASSILRSAPQEAQCKVLWVAAASAVAVHTPPQPRARCIREGGLGECLWRQREQVTHHGVVIHYAVALVSAAAAPSSGGCYWPLLGVMAPISRVDTLSALLGFRRWRLPGSVPRQLVPSASWGECCACGRFLGHARTGNSQRDVQLRPRLPRV